MAFERRIAHLDMDAFFASVELLRYPDLRGQPVVIGGGSTAKPIDLPDGTRQYARMRDYAGRGVVTTSTYEARAFGVFSAMGIMKAAQLAPDAILLPSDFDAYRRYSGLFKQAVAEIAPLIEDRGIDEIYLDLSDIDEDPRALGARIKQAVNARTGLTCSIGIAPNKLLAKICSDLEKPNGLTLITPADIPTRIWPLAVGKINGIGPKANAKLKGMGITTIGDLAQTTMEFLESQFTPRYAKWLADVARGIDDRPIVTSSESRSIGRETTFQRDMHAKRDRAELTDILQALCKRVSDDLARKGYVAKTVGIKIRYTDFSIRTRALTLPNYVINASDILHAARECLKRVPLGEKFRLIGVRVDNLERPGNIPAAIEPVQGDLFSGDDQA